MLNPNFIHKGCIGGPGEGTVVIYCKGVLSVVAFEISLPCIKTFYCPQRLHNHLYDVSALALLNPKTSRFVGQVTSYRSESNFDGPGLIL